MACNCRRETEKKLLDLFKEQHPQATDPKLRLEGYALIVNDQGLTEKGCMTITATALHPLKKGGIKEKKTTQNMIFNYCPFCGKSYDEKPEVADGCVTGA